MASHRRLAAALAIAIATALTVAAAWARPAAAALVPGESLAGVTIGQSAAGVRKQLGKPRKRTTQRDPFRRVWHYRRLRIYFFDAMVVQVQTTRSGERDEATGIGIGSTMSEMRAAYSGERCRTSGNAVRCTIGQTGGSGERSSTFAGTAARISSIEIAVVI